MYINKLTKKDKFAEFTKFTNCTGMICALSIHTIHDFIVRFADDDTPFEQIMRSMRPVKAASQHVLRRNSPAPPSGSQTTIN